ncbi:helicase associated domain-containing protein [Streptomyces lydicus]
MKTARIIIPIFLQPGEDPKDMAASASYQPLVDILQGLRSHSERMVDQLASRALTRGQERRRLHVRPAPGGAGAEREEAEEAVNEAQREVDRVDAVVVNFARPRDAADVAALTRCRVIRPESLVWLEGYQALSRWRAENEITGLHAVSYDVETAAGSTEAFPLGRWVHQQRRALRACEVDPHRKELLDEAGMVWEPGEEAWESKLAALRSYRRATGHLAPRQDAVWGEGEAMVPIGQHMANLRRKGGLGKNAERAEERAKQLTAIDPDWNCPWPLGWQRHYRVLADLVDADGALPAIEPGVLFEGDDIGRWLARQREASTWVQLSTEQQERLSALGVQPAVAPSPAPTTKRAAKGAGQSTAGIPTRPRRPGAGRRSAAAQGSGGLPDGTETKVGVWYANQKQRRDKLTEEQLEALRALGVQWA